MRKTPADYIAQEGDIDVYDIETEGERAVAETEGRSVAERCIDAGMYMTRDCSSAMKFMPSLTKRLDL